MKTVSHSAKFIKSDSPASSKSYPCSKQLIRSQVIPEKDVKVILRRCGCGSSWCPICFKNGAKKRMLRRLGLFDWRRTRHVMLSVDRDLFTGGMEAWDYITEKKMIAHFVWNLRRTVGLQVIDWMWFMEFHSDGFPHWHVFIEVEKEGKGGMIGGDVLRKYWPWGRWVTEKPIYDEGHWNSLVGYFDKHGYFGKDKGVQGELPEWAKDCEKKIRRYGAMVLPSSSDDKEKVVKAIRWRCSDRKRRTYRMILEDCGQKTMVVIENEMVRVRRTVSIPYRTMREELKGDYVEGVGYLVEIDQGELFLLGERYDAFLGVISEIVEQESRYYEWGDEYGAEV